MFLALFAALLDVVLFKRITERPGLTRSVLHRLFVALPRQARQRYHEWQFPVIEAGLTWQNIGPLHPHNGELLDIDASKGFGKLSLAIRAQQEAGVSIPLFSREELLELGVDQPILIHSYIRVGPTFFQTNKKAPPAAREDKSPPLHSTTEAEAATAAEDVGANNEVDVEAGEARGDGGDDGEMPTPVPLPSPTRFSFSGAASPPSKPPKVQSAHTEDVAASPSYEALRHRMRRPLELAQSSRRFVSQIDKDRMKAWMGKARDRARQAALRAKGDAAGYVAVAKVMAQKELAESAKTITESPIGKMVAQSPVTQKVVAVAVPVAKRTAAMAKQTAAPVAAKIKSEARKAAASAAHSLAEARKPPAGGLLWEDIGPLPPLKGTQLADCKQLVEALRRKQLSFEPTDIEAFGLGPVIAGDYVRVGPTFFQTKASRRAPHTPAAQGTHPAPAAASLMSQDTPQLSA